jgi:hypothetical protein
MNLTMLLATRHAEVLRGEDGDMEKKADQEVTMEVTTEGEKNPGEEPLLILGGLRF